MSKRRRKLKSYERCPLKFEGGFRCALPLNHDGWCESRISHGVGLIGPGPKVRAAMEDPET